MSEANVLNELGKLVCRERSRGLVNLELFGRVRCLIKRPYFISEDLTPDRGNYAIADIYAVKCLEKDYFCGDGYRDVNSLYGTKGSVIIFLKDSEYVGKNVKIFGAGRSKGVNLKRQFGAKDYLEGLTALSFRYNSGTYVIIPNRLEELTVDDKDIFGTALQEELQGIIGNMDEVTYPACTDVMQSFCGVKEYEEVSIVSESNNKESASIEKTSSGRVDIAKIDKKLTYHLDAPEESDFYSPLINESDDMKHKRNEYIKCFKDDVNSMLAMERDIDFDPVDAGYSGEGYMPVGDVAVDIKERFIREFASKYNEKVGGRFKCGSVVASFLDSFYATKWSGEDDLDYDRISDRVIELKKEVTYNSSCLARDTRVPILCNPYQFASLVIATVSGIGENAVVGNHNSCMRFNRVSSETWFYLLIRNPYALAMMGSGLSVEDCDCIYFSIGVKYNSGMYYDDAMSCRKELMILSKIDTVGNRDSLVKEYMVLKGGFEYSGTYKKLVGMNGYPAKINNKLGLERLVGGRLSFNYNEMVEGISLDKTDLDALEEKGLVTYLGLNGTNYYTLASNLEKELLIYNVLHEKGSQETGITDSQVDKAIDEFEESRGFKLENLQRDGIKLCKYKAAVLSGCAGSGKTTTSDCITEVLEKNLLGYKIVYGTPTGKACRRLAEVVGGNVKTLHSLFGVSIGNAPYFSTLGKRYRDTDEKRIYILDEMAMCSMDLLYEVVRNLTDGDLIYFLGDIKQLPPIGRGNPFKLLMNILPCVELGVSKRAAEGSLINYNCSLINFVSDDVMVDLEYDDSSFIKVDCSDGEIPMEVSKLFTKYMKNGYSEDDIQVITGYQKESIVFSAPKLNDPLHSMLRKNDRVLFKYMDKEFCENERVIHLKRNAYEMPRYREVGNTLKEVVTFGVVNGEMGKVVGFVRSDSVNIIPFDRGEVDDVEYAELLDKREEKEDILRDDRTFKGENQYFVKVRVYDVDLKEDVIVLYRVRSMKAQGETVFIGGDLPYLDYAYALTTHKMQGSQSPVVIAVYGSSCNPYFVNRNMINTMITRSQEVVALVGSISGSESPIMAGRGQVSPVYCKDSLSLLGGALDDGAVY